MWKEPYYDKLRVSQASWRLFQCSRKILCKFQLREVGSKATVRTMWCSGPDALQLATSVWTMRTFRPDSQQCLETSNYSRLHPSGHFKSSRRIQYSSASIRMPFSVRVEIGFHVQTRIGKQQSSRRKGNTVWTHFKFPGRFLRTS